MHFAKILVKRLPTIPTSGLTLDVTKCTYLQFKDLFYNKWMKQLLFQFFGESFFKYLIMLCIIVLRNCSASYRYIFLSFFLAFSFFSAFEYVIAYSNMGYHVTGYLEFKNKSILAADFISDSVYTNGDAHEVKAIAQDQEDEKDGYHKNLRIRKKGAGENVQWINRAFCYCFKSCNVPIFIVFMMCMTVL